MNSEHIQHNVQKVQQSISEAEKKAHRNPNSVLLLAVSKSQGIDSIKELYKLGISHFGENYVQEACAKMYALKELPLCWHFIGPIQSNKTKGIATHFSWVHSIDRLNIALLLNKYRAIDAAPLEVCLQINLVSEKTKSGVAPEQALELALAISQLEKLHLRGLMTIPSVPKNAEEQYQLFMKLKCLMDRINQQAGLKMDTLSMGMSQDFVPAILAGSTIIRIGHALFE